MSLSAQFDCWHESAMAATGLRDFGSDDYHAALRLLLSDLDRYPRFNALGLSTIAEQVTGLLVARLIRQSGLTQNPATLATPILRPLFIVGMARTGTTALHRLIALDAQTQSLPFWLGNIPMPRPPRETWDAHPLFQRVKQALEQSAFLNEELRKVHPVDADMPDECRWSIDQSFWSSTFAQTTRNPNYAAWYIDTDARYAYQYHRQTLCLVANGDTRRWILKDPAHIFGMDALLAVFPDACIVQMHREPLACMRSIANLAWEVRRKHMELDATMEETGTLLLENWAAGLRKMERVRAAHDPAQFLDLHIDEFRADPVRAIERIYEYFGFPVNDAALGAWRRQAEIDRASTHLAAGRAPDFGLTRERVNALLGDYLERYWQVTERAAHFTKGDHR